MKNRKNADAATILASCRATCAELIEKLDNTGYAICECVYASFHTAIDSETVAALAKHLNVRKGYENDQGYILRALTRDVLGSDQRQLAHKYGDAMQQALAEGVPPEDVRKFLKKTGIVRAAEKFRKNRRGVTTKSSAGKSAKEKSPAIGMELLLADLMQVADRRRKKGKTGRATVTRKITYLPDFDRRTPEIVKLSRVPKSTRGSKLKPPTRRRPKNDPDDDWED